MTEYTAKVFLYTTIYVDLDLDEAQNVDEAVALELPNIELDEIHFNFEVQRLTERK